MTKLKAVELLVVHCSATRAASDIGAKEIRGWHLARGWADIGYHFVIRRNGTLEPGRKITDVGAHVEGHNSNSLGICVVGGLKPDGKTPECNFTAEQFRTLTNLLVELTAKHPGARVCGHRDLSPDANHDGKIEPREWLKACPTFNVEPWWAGAKPKPPAPVATPIAAPAPA